jgi:hypothetical protein
MHISPLKLGLLLPVALYVLWLLVGLVLGRRPSRFSLKTSLSLLLLFYFLAVTGTGIFWVATQHLPPFDLHYLIGYFFLALGLAHVAINWRTIATFVRGKAPSAVKEPGGRRFRSWVKGLGIVALALVCGATVFLAGGRYASDRYVIQVTEGGKCATEAGRRLVFDGEEMSLARFYHRKTAFPLLSSIRLLFKEMKPLPPYKEYPGKEAVALPASKPAGGGSLLEAFDSWRSPVANLAGDSSMSPRG